MNMIEIIVLNIILIRYFNQYYYSQVLDFDNKGFLRIFAVETYHG